MDKFPITRTGFQKLLQELLYLRRRVRPEVLDELAESRVYGYKINNQQFLWAQERHAFVQGKIQNLEYKLARCEVVVGQKLIVKRIAFGTRTVVLNLDTGEETCYQLVGPFESDVENGKLSICSPVGRNLMGRMVGDEISVYTPGGIRNYRVLEILLQYP